MNQELEFDITSIPTEFNPLAGTLGDSGNQNAFAGDERLFVQFRTEAVLNPSKSTKEGRPVFDEVDMIILRTPGSQLTSIIAPVKHYMDRFGDRYKKWKAGQKDTAVGTPLEVFPFLFNKVGMIAELKAMNITSIEQLAELSDNFKQRIMGGFELSRKAADFLEGTTGTNARIEKLSSEKADLEKRLAALEFQMTMKDAAHQPKGKG